jgi:integrase
MPAYKDKERNHWFCQFTYEDWRGEKQRIKKRGFKTKKEALAWEVDFKSKADGSMDMTLENFVEVYFRDKEGELKERSIENKRYMIEAHVLPYFGDKPMNSITPSDLIQWQNQIKAKGFSPTYLRMIQNQITALFTHASTIYNLSNNPCKKVKKMGKSDADKLDFWTELEYEQFISVVERDSYYYVMFEILFWTGCREGELLALTKQDVDFRENRLHINKTYYRSGGQDVITIPKTEQSVRTIEIPEFLTEEIQEYVDRMYGLKSDERMFPVGAEALQHAMKRYAERSGVKKIRIHDIRHSHVAYLIDQGVEPLLIKERLGHKDIKITLNTYGHLYPSRQREIARMLERKKGGRDER